MLIGFLKEIIFPRRNPISWRLSPIMVIVGSRVLKLFSKLSRVPKLKSTLAIIFLEFTPP